MSITVNVTISGTIGLSAGPFDIYHTPINPSNDGTLVISGVSRATLIGSGQLITVPDGTTTIRVRSTGTCTFYDDETIVIPSPSPTPTATAAPTYKIRVLYGYTTTYQDQTGCESFTYDRYWRTVYIKLVDNSGSDVANGATPLDVDISFSGGNNAILTIEPFQASGTETSYQFVYQQTVDNGIACVQEYDEPVCVFSLPIGYTLYEGFSNVPLCNP